VNKSTNAKNNNRPHPKRKDNAPHPSEDLHHKVACVVVGDSGQRIVTTVHDELVPVSHFVLPFVQEGLGELLSPDFYTFREK